jgi:hypothetical protein
VDLNSDIAAHTLRNGNNVTKWFSAQTHAAQSNSVIMPLILLLRYVVERVAWHAPNKGGLPSAAECGRGETLLLLLEIGAEARTDGRK